MAQISLFLAKTDERDRIAVLVFPHNKTLLHAVQLTEQHRAFRPVEPRPLQEDNRETLHSKTTDVRQAFSHDQKQLHPLPLSAKTRFQNVRFATIKEINYPCVNDWARFEILRSRALLGESWTGEVYKEGASVEMPIGWMVAIDQSIQQTHDSISREAVRRVRVFPSGQRT